MFNFIDDWLNRTTMYRLVLYYLIFLLGVAVLFSFAGVLRYDPFALMFSISFLVLVCWVANTVFSKVFAAPTNTESVYITALILALIITPIASLQDLWFLGWAGAWAMASKYIIALDKKHVFNPAAFAVALTYLTINQSASWWIGSAPMLPFVLLGGVLIVRKLKRADLVNSFLLAALVAILVFSLLAGQDALGGIQKVVLYSPLFFFAFIILTEPLTTPPTHARRVAYGALVGVLFVPQFHLGGFFTTPELAILLGNVFSYIVSPKAKLVLRLAKKVQLAPDIYDFYFAPPRKLAFAPGQYMEWTLGLHDPDNRGNRRYFTLASSPTEENIRLGVKFYPEPSTFKEALLSMDQDSEIVASQLAGDFVLPRDPKQKIVLIAGGIGITPFRSMLQYLLDTHQGRPIVLFYAAKTIKDFVYVDVLERARKELGIKTVYTIEDAHSAPANWKWPVGRVTPQMIQKRVPDYQERIFYISGPRAMVDSFKESLGQLGVESSHVKTDYFPGFV